MLSARDLFIIDNVVILERPKPTAAIKACGAWMLLSLPYDPIKTAFAKPWALSE